MLQNMVQFMIFFVVQQNVGEDIIDFFVVGICQINYYFGEEIWVEIVIYMFFLVC